jgi:hypothetical protein
MTLANGRFWHIATFAAAHRCLEFASASEELRTHKDRRRGSPLTRFDPKRSWSGSSFNHLAARSRNASGIFRPSAFAVVRLMTRSNPPSQAC